MMYQFMSTFKDCKTVNLILHNVSEVIKIVVVRLRRITKVDSKSIYIIVLVFDACYVQ